MQPFGFSRSPGKPSVEASAVGTVWLYNERFEMTASKLRNVLAMFTFIGMLTGCATVSLEQPKSYSTAITDTDDTVLGQDAANKPLNMTINPVSTR
jgi:hypothetical protein